MQQMIVETQTPSQPNQDALEPGLLPVVRIILVVEALLLPVPIAASLVQQRALPSFTLHAAVLAVLFVLVFWPGMPKRLGRWFLPTFISLYTFSAIANHVLVFNWVLQQPSLRTYVVATINPMSAGDNSWSLFIFLLLPLVLVAWQYDFTRVVVFVVVAAALESLALGGVMWRNDLPVFPQALVGVGHGLVLLMVGYIVTRMMNAQRAQRRELAAYAATLEQLAVSRERNRMARELHDTLAHSLSAVAVQLEAVDSAMDTSPETAHTLLIKALAQTRSGLTETRRSMQALRASPLEDLGLALAVKTLAESTAKRAGITAEIAVPEQQLSLSPVVEQGVYRVAQEALSNVVHHAGATHLLLSLSYANQLSLLVHDNGRGFDVGENSANGHYGIQGMRERAEMIGGTLDIQSSAAAGTSVKLVVP
jgi:signal transduction histidine kinase